MTNDMRGLWRGKTTPKRSGEAFNNIWVEGDLIHSEEFCYIHPFANTVIVQRELGRLIVMHEVDPSTLGKCVGFPDKNGKPIFDGDIVRHYCYKGEPTRFEVGVIFWEEKHARFKRTSNDGDTYFIVYDEAYPYEVIGNIHDNPELLKGAENNGSRS